MSVRITPTISESDVSAGSFVIPFARDVTVRGSDQFGIAAFEHGFKICEDRFLAIEMVNNVPFGRVDCQ